MAFWNRKKSADTSWVELADFLGIKNVNEKAISEATYFTCLKILSESLAKLPLKLQSTTADKGVVTLKENPLYQMARYRPNKYMTASAFWGTVEMQRNHYGNAYVLMTGFKTNNPQMWILNSADVELWYDDKKLLSEVPELWYIYSQNGKKYKYTSSQILHFKTSTSFDGILGLSVQDKLKSTIRGATKSQAMLHKLYDNGFVAKAVVQYTGDLNDDNAKNFIRGIEKFATGEDELVKTMIPLPMGTTLTPLNIKLTDAQFIELRKYTALQVAAAFGIKPNQINDYEKASYASAEAQQLAFYVDTLLYIIKQYEEELSYKWLTAEERLSGQHFKFNVGVILRADSKTQVESLSRAVLSAVYTPNEAREMLDLPHRAGGDELFMNGGYVPINGRKEGEK